MFRFPSDAHPVGFLTDNNLVTTWQSTANTSDVNVTFSFTEQSNVSAVELFFKSPRPRAVAIEISSDQQLTWRPLQYYAEDCQAWFGVPDDAR